MSRHNQSALAFEEPPYVVFLEGNISAGKTTIGEKLNAKKIKGRSIHFIPEAIDEWKDKYTNPDDSTNILGNFYRELHGEIKDGWAFTFQMMVIMERYYQQISAVKRHPGEILIFERGLETDSRCFASNLEESGHIDPIHMMVYKRWLKYFLSEHKNRLPKPLYIYLRTSATTCLDRNNQRARAEESQLDIAYLEQLEAKHDSWLDGVHQVDGGQSVQLVTRNIIDYLKKIVATNPYFPTRLDKEIVTPTPLIDEDPEEYFEADEPELFDTIRTSITTSDGENSRSNGFRPSVYDNKEIEKWKTIEISNLRRTWKEAEIKRIFDARGWPMQNITNIGGMKRDKLNVEVPDEIAGTIVRELIQTKTNLYIKGRLGATIVVGTTIANRRQQELKQPEQQQRTVRPSILDVRRSRVGSQTNQ